MAETMRQVQITKYWIGRFEDALNALDLRDDMHPVQLKVNKEALQSQLQSLRDELATADASAPQSGDGGSEGAE